jgi:predicted O-linked N-acetylglucosamine transferase (SPINDLY family)
MAMRPAPISVTWIGYPNTTGLSCIDYRITDAIADLPETKQKYTEKLVRLPGPFLCYTPPHEAPEVAEAPAVANGYVTFGSFNNLAKVNSRVLTAWCAILKAVPTSRMLVKCKPFATESIRKQMQQKFEDLGVDAKRVELTALLPTTKEHLSMYALVDMGLDTFPYAGTTTTCEALFMGVPVITLTRPSNYAHSVGATLLSRIEGLSELVCGDEKEYVAKSVALASDIKRLAALRQTLRPNMLKSPVADGKGFTKNLEKQFNSLWKDYVKVAKKQRKSISSPISPAGSSE